MRYGFVLPGGTAGQQLAQAEAAEAAGWDAVFAWESHYGVDPWSLLSAIAVRTERIRLGTMLTPLPWRRPWKLAAQVATLDQLSDGRAILAVGLGAVDDALGTTGEVVDRRERAGRMDEGLEVIKRLWTGEPTYTGEHYQVDLTGRGDIGAPGRGIQEPHVPIWIVGAWNRPKSMARVLQGNGILPNVVSAEGEHGELTPDAVRAMRTWLDEHGAPADFDIVAEGETPADDPEAAAAQVEPWADAGATWWLEAAWAMSDADAVTARIEAGPPHRSGA